VWFVATVSELPHAQGENVTIVNHMSRRAVDFAPGGQRGASSMNARIPAVALFGCMALLPATAAAQSPPVYDWTGFYLGASGGFASANFEVGNILFEGGPPPIPLDFSLDANGAIVGGGVGFNRQFGSFVAGLEGDVSWTSLEESHFDPVANFTGTGELEWLATFRGRVGFTVDRFLIFGTGGAAFGEINATIDDVYPAGTITTTDSNVHFGWTAGGGGEIAVTDRVSIKGEGLFYDLGSESYSFYEGPGGWNPITADIDASGWLGRLGVNVRY
jgi:outer membrane immunogenic protein